MTNAPGSRKTAQKLFTLSGKCQACHNGMLSPSGQDVSMGVDWRASMMAHSAKDPYWQASVRRETLVHPSAAEHIQDECAACHMPMARFKAHTAGRLGSVFKHLPLLPARNRSGQLAEDGVACAMCHQIQNEGLGEPESFTAGFTVDTTTLPGRRPAFGPYETDAGRQRIMRSSTDLVPTNGLHVQDSALCGSCHTLYTTTLNAKGEAVGELPEQMPYLEWRHSAYSGTESCQSCHMPVMERDMPITSVIGQTRSNVSQHVFLGGNFFMLGLLSRNAADLSVTALPQDLSQSIRRTRENLQTASARIAIRRIERKASRLHATVSVTNLTGHKLPTAYPSRRTWISFQVFNTNGAALFASGRLNPDGSIQGNDNDVDPGRHEPHYDEIDSADEVQIYEAIMADLDDNVTTVLLSAIRYIKDNRLLPVGFDKATAHSDIAVQGPARTDDDFTGGNDSVRYSVDLSKASEGPLTVVTELWYQPIAFRWAKNLMQQPSDEARRFVDYFEAESANTGIILARDKQIIE